MGARPLVNVQICVVAMPVAGLPVQRLLSVLAKKKNGTRRDLLCGMIGTNAERLVLRNLNARPELFEANFRQALVGILGQGGTECG
jgi:hypothetical protein